MSYHNVKDKLAQAARRAQNRDFSEDIDYLESIQAEKLIADAFNVDFSTGLRIVEVDENRRKFGANRSEAPNEASFLKSFSEALQDYVLLTLIVLSLLSVLLNYLLDPEHRSVGWIEGGTIFVAVFITALILATRSYYTGKNLEKYRNTRSSGEKAMVIRDGMAIHESSTELVCGDIITIEAGSIFSVDALVLEGSGIQVDESNLSGETAAMKKDTLTNCLKLRNSTARVGADRNTLPSPIILAGSKILAGTGKCVVIQVGSSTAMGQLNELVMPEEAEKTALQLKLSTIAQDAGKFGLCAVLLVFLSLIARCILQGIQNGGFRWTELIHYLIVVVMILLAAVPESLPLIANYSVASTVQGLLRNNVLVRRLDACENLGSIDVVCVEKTGILTHGELRLTRFWNETLHHISSGKDIFENIRLPAPKELVLQAFVCNSTSGSAIDQALLEGACNFGISLDEFTKKYVNESTLKFPHTSKRKRASIILENVPNTTSRRRLLTKGASEIVLGSCNQIHLLSEDKVVHITSEKRASIEQAINKFGEEGRRTVALAYKDLSSNEDLKTVDSSDVYNVEKEGLTLIGILAFEDRLRAEAAETVSAFQQAGIKVIMVTADNKLTSKIVAQQCFMVDSPDALVLDGPEFRNLVGGITNGKVQNPRELKKIARNLDVLARATPEDKLALVSGLQELGYVVAVTGSGTNDAPALKKANIGFGMGISGTDIVRATSDLILLDDNIRSILSGVSWGRNIRATIKKYIQLQFTAISVIVLSTLFGSIFYGMAILTPVQILWITLVFDILAALAISNEKPESRLLKKRSYDNLLTSGVKKFVIVHSVYQLIVILVLTCFGDQFLPEESNLQDPRDSFADKDGNPTQIRFSPYGNGNQYVISGRLYHMNGVDDYYPYQHELGSSRHMTIVFNTYMFMQIFNLFNARKVGNKFNIFAGLLENTIFLIWILFIIILQVLLGTFGGRALSVFRDGMTLTQWGIAIGFGLGEWIVGALSKLIPSGAKDRSKSQQNYAQLRDEPEVELQQQRNQNISL